jgi:hypothetical protein
VELKQVAQQDAEKQRFLVEKVNKSNQICINLYLFYSLKG